VIPAFQITKTKVDLKLNTNNCSLTPIKSLLNFIKYNGDSDSNEEDNYYNQEVFQTNDIIEDDKLSTITTTNTMDYVTKNLDLKSIRYVDSDDDSSSDDDDYNNNENIYADDDFNENDFDENIDSSDDDDN
jgi:hypothetical protein